MSPRRSQVELAEEAEARVRKEEARAKLEALKLRRESYKARRKMLAVHRAAEVNRLTKDWTANPTSADSAIIPDLVRVNARARQAVRDDSWAKSIVRSKRRNVVGTGITPSIDGQPYQADWLRWSTTPALMDRERRRTFHNVQQWAIDEATVVGECFVVRWVLGQGRARRLVLELFEFEQLDRYKISERSTGNEVRHGIEVDEHGAPVAYHFYRHHPNDIRGLARPAPLMLDSIRIPAEIVSHIYQPERVRQTHGISEFAPVLRKIRDLSEYDAAQLRAARAEASIGLLIKGGDDSDEDDTLNLDGLNVAYLNQDEDVTPFTPSRPGGEYDPFTRMQVRSIAAGTGTSYDQVARDFDGGSFSAKRQGAIEDRREWEPEQIMLIGQLCRPVLQDFTFIWAMQNPGRSGDFFLRSEEEEIDWRGQGWEWVDPEQQGKGVERQMRLGLTSRTREANLLGTTVRKLDKEIASDGTLEALDRLNPDKRENPAPDSAVPATPETSVERETGVPDAV